LPRRPRIVHGKQCDHRQYRDYCDCISLAAIGSLVTWAWVGAALRNWLGIGSRMRTFNVAMGVLLAATALWLAML
jgi:threonine/homoserine/homoserine lactone efflux protein